MQDFEIQILDEGAGGPAVVTNPGTPAAKRMPCNSLDEARCYATGLQDGWTAARRAIGAAHVRHAFTPAKES